MRWGWAWGPCRVKWVVWAWWYIRPKSGMEGFRLQRPQNSWEGNYRNNHRDVLCAWSEYVAMNCTGGTRKGLFIRSIVTVVYVGNFFLRIPFFKFQCLFRFLMVEKGCSFSPANPKTLIPSSFLGKFHAWFSWSMPLNRKFVLMVV